MTTATGGPTARTGSDAPALGFGVHFTPHMVVSRWTPAGGWTPLELVPHGPLSLSPAAMALHYGQAVFEGLKAYPAADGSLALFRPRANADRFVLSARRLAMPELPVEMFLDACERVVRADAAEVPRGHGQSLYLRPFMVAVEPSLGVRPAQEYLFAVIASPVDYFFAGGYQAIDVWCATDQIRAAPGGTGAAKCAGNYAGSLSAKAEALANGCQEVLWLDAAEHRWVEELGAMNFFCVGRGENGTDQLITPGLSGTILAGNTRDSLLTLAAGLGLDVVQRPVSVDELTAADGRVTEAFACGTAASVVPIGAVTTPSGRARIGDGRPGKVTTRLRDELAAVQYRQQADPYGWMHAVDMG
ncbi:branched-chain amino acid aminotransferase [Kitasatospora sp. NPDC056138]|uniref:branched-chain amino acid aminotransferase n=1 Tax=Kitasatospora sp. NPDC056138 TaxID=3345724 RepID=UPI0035DAE215